MLSQLYSVLPPVFSNQHHGCYPSRPTSPSFGLSPSFSLCDAKLTTTFPQRLPLRRARGRIPRDHLPRTPCPQSDPITPTQPRAFFSKLQLISPSPPSSQIHGFPDISMGWRYQIPMLLSLGLRVVAPDCMGYGRTVSLVNPKSISGCWGLMLMLMGK
jgi:hypothetical protein